MLTSSSAEITASSEDKVTVASTLLMNHLYGNFDKETQSSTFSIDDVIDDCIITKEDKTNPNYEKHFNKKNIVTTYTHKIYGDILVIIHTNLKSCICISS